MSADSPVSILYNSDGYELVVSDGQSLLNKSAILVAGKNGSNAKYLTIDASGNVLITGAVTATGTVTANIGTTNGLALDTTLTDGYQTSRLTDGTNTATIKAASTAAIASDKALVVALSPNNVPYVNLNPNKLVKDLSSAVINFSASGDNIVIAGLPSTTIRIFKLFLVVGSSTNITIKNNLTALTGPIPMLAFGSMVLDFDSDPWFVTSTGNDFVINSSSAAQISGTVYYTQS